MKSTLKLLFLCMIAGIGIGLLKDQWKLQQPDSPSLEAATSPDLKSDSSMIARPGSQRNSVRPEMAMNTPEVSAKIEILEDILKSKNDNDPRLDIEFKTLSEPVKLALTRKYSELSSESLNERGTIVFLLGRNLSSSRDFEFFKNVLQEQPCLSLENCQQNQTQSDPEDDAVNEVTLVYPQIVALKSLENYLKKNPDSSQAKTILGIATETKNDTIRKIAFAILNRS